MVMVCKVKKAMGQNIRVYGGKKSKRGERYGNKKLK